MGRRTAAAVSAAAVALLVLAAPAVAPSSAAAVPPAAPGASASPSPSPSATPDVGADVEVEQLSVPVGAEPSAPDEPVALDAAVYRTAGGTDRRPAVLLAHGFLSTRADRDGQARELAAEGFVVLTWSARGFGDSGGLVHLDAPDFEVADARALVDVLAERRDVLLDETGDPRVGVVGGSYGGALALLLAGTDDRVDAAAAAITWHDLMSSLAPSTTAAPTTANGGASTPAAVTSTQPGVLKRAWATQLAASRGALPVGTPQGAGDGGAATAGGGPGPGACGSLAPDLCAGYLDAIATGEVGDDLAALLRASSPASVLDDVDAPVLLVQGQQDSLFPLTEADANARQLAAAGSDVRVRWIAGGHDAGAGAGGGFGSAEDELAPFLREVLAGDPAADGAATFRADVVEDDDLGAALGAAAQQPGAPPVAGLAEEDDDREVLELPGYPGLTISGGDGADEGADGGAPALEVRAVPLVGDPQQVLSPAGGTPSALTTLPGAGAAAGALGGGLAALGSALAVLPGQSATFDSAELEDDVLVAGAPTVRLVVTSTASDATLFTGLLEVPSDGRAVLPRQLVAPVRLTGLVPGEPTRVDVALPAVLQRYAAGSTMRLLVSSTDQGYAVPQDGRVYGVALASEDAEPAVRVPVAPGDDVATVAASTDDGGGVEVPWGLVVALAVVLLLAALLGPVSRRVDARRAAPATVPALGGGVLAGAASLEGDGPPPPLVVDGLALVYASGLRAVDGVSFTVGRGQVVGLLGPNGAGKTSTLRMVLGLVHPTEGRTLVLGHEVVPGAAVLSQVGAFVEGPGLLPHATGIANLRLAWQATGRPLEDARIDEVLEIAALGDAVHRPVRGYSQGMRARIAIAQAMLGLPDVLVLDEPTNGLDPPQIRALRDVLRGYAASGRAVLVSSHLLAEVEMTCTHAVIMRRGQVVAGGSLEELTSGGTGDGHGGTAVVVDDVERARAALADLPGARVDAAAEHADAEDRPVPGDGELTVTGAEPEDVVRALVTAGVAVHRVAPRRRLEEVFLEVTGT
ncbi:alpha/beta fold hydrolase [uncultured Pseudokineococcus sp.]|uniref:alpha/beta fold hydrolase n=1 Tax=uncultured Pseudokineococcus sp. TaxID=1642928 RepID=UPI002617BBD2|nr:alpha/beta fold hydrolase [uncultured Pseudokineococcus sp.]